jgi:hypothetical protein
MTLFAETFPFQQMDLRNTDSDPNRTPPTAPFDDQSIGRLAMYMRLAGQGHGVDLNSFVGSGNSEGNKEKERIADRLNGFNVKDNSVWRAITKRFGANLKQQELLSIAKVLASHANVKLDRDAKRRKSVLVKWFDEHWEELTPFLDYVVLEDNHV